MTAKTVKGAQAVKKTSVSTKKVAKAVYKPVSNKKSYVYQGVKKKTGQTYYGITNNLAKRAAQHKKKGIKIQNVLQGVHKRKTARMIEQQLINTARLNGISLANKINSIAVKKFTERMKDKAGRILLKRKFMPFL